MSMSVTFLRCAESILKNCTKPDNKKFIIYGVAMLFQGHMTSSFFKTLRLHYLCNNEAPNFGKTWSHMIMGSLSLEIVALYAC